jgi:hypothetical protein
MKVVVQAEVAGHVRTVTVDVKSTDTVESVVNSYAKSVRKKSPFRGGQPVLYSESGAELQLDEQLDNLNIKEGTTVFLRVKSRESIVVLQQMGRYDRAISSRLVSWLAQVREKKLRCISIGMTTQMNKN